MMPTPDSPEVAVRPILLTSLMTVLATLLTASCGINYRDVPKTPSAALKKAPSSGVAGQFEAAARRHPGKSGFAALGGNREAFTSRVALADFARETLDVQYYIWTADTIGLTLADHLIQAADRGVRVRFLLDDVNFKKRDSTTAKIAAHPNIEVRIFNPHRYRNLRTTEFLANFGRLNKRMHNKIMVMDNSVAIIGGRNIADEYFGLGESFNNRDLDIAAAGPIVRDISATFDEFWNSAGAIPIEGFVREVPDMNDFREQLAVLRGNIRPERYPFPLKQDVDDLRGRIDDIADKMVWAKGEVLHDSFESMRGNDPDGKMNIQLHSEIAAAKRSVKIEAAYFILRDSGVETTRQLTERGVKVRTLTNALAGNDVVAAQAGHTKRRPQVLRAGMEVYELRPDAPAMLSQVAPYATSSRSALHTKSLVIDSEKTFIGSFNLDPRSADINSEIGLLVHSKAFAKQVEDFLDEGVRPENAYRVTLDDKGKTLWTAEVDGETKTWTHDPETSFGRRFMNGLMTLLPIEDQL
ncbi:phospholipase D family protein [Haloferula helveola]|uniref:Phospholipase D family protein n=1 Tax=Haloferula helveola TaxID=490095 RepID=A0ABN6H9U0_9BACT|nr:phospholipase D family protein [Haloferula helveola]